MFDFCERVSQRDCSYATITILIKAGAFDSLGCKRSQLTQVLEKAFHAGKAAAADRAIGQKSLFDDVENPETVDPQEEIAAAVQGLPDIPEWDDKEKLAYEKEVLGFYLSSHPLKHYADQFQTFASHTTVAAVLLPDRKEVVLGGMLGAIKLTQTKNPKPDRPSQYAMFDLEDVDGMIRCIIWPEQYATYSQLVKAESVVIAVGKIDKSRSQADDDANFIIDRLLTLEEAQTQMTRGVTITVPESRGEDTLRTLYEIVRGYPGSSELELHLRFDNGHLALMKCKTGVTLNPEMRRRVTELLGEENYRLIAAPQRIMSGNSGTPHNGGKWQKHSG
jgi:DNA polymerase-3 subunit alpha